MYKNTNIKINYGNKLFRDFIIKSIMIILVSSLNTFSFNEVKIFEKILDNG
jgi:hypothetical protein